ncbi:hypothetical protein QE152_g22873 [Popillia japonica]|uniref:Uncharacterized protein n=1 Tax=Popillia japonica TaxID=7064 RepID=A0AAW1KH93_POPJA
MAKRKARKAAELLISPENLEKRKILSIKKRRKYEQSCSKTVQSRPGPAKEDGNKEASKCGKQMKPGLRLPTGHKKLLLEQDKSNFQRCRTRNTCNNLLHQIEDVENSELLELTTPKTLEADSCNSPSVESLKSTLTTTPQEVRPYPKATPRNKKQKENLASPEL